LMKSRKTGITSLVIEMPMIIHLLSASETIICRQKMGKERK